MARAKSVHWGKDAVSLVRVIEFVDSLAWRVDCLAANIPSAKPGYYKGCFLVATDTGKWYRNTGSSTSCTFTEQAALDVDLSTLTATAAELNVLHSVTAGTAAASSGVVLDANTAVAGLKITLGTATTVQSQPVAGLTPDLTGAASGTTQSTFYSLASVALPANAMSANGKGFRFFFSATTASNANAKDFRLAIGGTATVTMVTGSTANAKQVIAVGSVFRTSAGAQRVWGVITIDATPQAFNTTAAADETTALTIAVQSQNTAAAAASATGTGLLLEFVN